MTQTSWIRSNEVEVHYSLLQKDFKKVSLELQRLKKKEEEGISQRTLQPECKQKPPQEYTIQICVFTYNRIVGLKRLWKSLVSADYQGDDVPLTIFFDRKDEDRDETEDWVKTLKWPHGKLRIHRRDSNTGLKKSIMEAWYPTSDPNTFAVFFEDDIEASTLWYKWSIAAIKEYALRDDRDEKLLGISLYRPIHDEMVGKKFHPDTNGDPYLFQQPCSWGAIYFPGPWARFRDWYLAGEKMHDPIAKGFGLPRISSNTWSHKSSWKKYLIKYMWLKGIFMVYPNPPNRTVLSTNHLMKVCKIMLFHQSVAGL